MRTRMRELNRIIRRKINYWNVFRFEGHSLRKVVNFYSLNVQKVLGLKRVKGMPYHIVIEPTNACNLRCPLCSTGLGNQSRPKGIMEFDNFKKIIDEIAPYVYELYLQNWGEPILVKHLPEMISYASQHNIYTYLSTNFSLKLTDTYIESIIKSGLNVLHVDVDGATQNVYEKYRVRGNLSIVLGNLGRAVEIKKSLGRKKPIIRAYMIVMSYNEHQIQETRALVKSLGVDQFKTGNAQIDPNDEYSRSFLPQNEKYIYPTYMDLERHEKCHWPWMGMVINWDGNTSVCCIVDDKRADFGNVLTSSVREVFNNDKYQSARAVFAKFLKSQKEETICSYCKNDTHSRQLSRFKGSYSLTLPTSVGASGGIAGEIEIVEQKQPSNG